MLNYDEWEIKQEACERCEALALFECQHDLGNEAVELMCDACGHRDWYPLYPKVINEA